MTYDFSFEKKSLAAILACASVLCVLLFFAGVMVGVGWHEKADSRAAAAATPAAARANAPASRTVATQDATPATASALPQEPVLYEGSARQQYVAEGYGQRSYDARGYDGAQPYGDARGYSAEDYAAAQTGARARTTQDVYAPQR